MPQTSSPLSPIAPAAGAARRRRLDLALGIVLGLVLGLGVVSAFVFLGSEGAIDAPRISGVDTGKPAPAEGENAPPAAGSRRQPRP